jgi:hypothetical protein
MSSTKLTNFFEGIAEGVLHFLWPGKRFETKLVRCQSYRRNSVTKWKNEAGLSWPTAIKTLNQIQIFDGQKIRELIGHAITRNQPIFSDENIFVTSFGRSAKSGEVIFYEFRQATNYPAKRIIEPWQISELPSHSRIIFVDDLIGTGTQSSGFIENKLIKLLSPSHRPCLFTICGTPTGMNLVREKTGFDVISALELKERDYDYFHPENKTFSNSEKNKLKELNSLFGESDYHLGLLLAFYYSTPNNTMPFVWKEGWKYKNKAGVEKEWFSLLPRKY